MVCVGRMKSSFIGTPTAINFLMLTNRSDNSKLYCYIRVARRFRFDRRNRPAATEPLLAAIKGATDPSALRAWGSGSVAARLGARRRQSRRPEPPRYADIAI